MVITLSGVESVCTSSWDFITKKPLQMDYNNDEYIGATEIIINSTEDIMKIAKIVQKERATRGHGMNDTSS